MQSRSYSLDGDGIRAEGDEPYAMNWFNHSNILNVKHKFAMCHYVDVFVAKQC